MRAVILFADDKPALADDQPPPCLIPANGTLPIDRFLTALRSVGISDRTAVVPKAGMVWGPRWHRSLEVRGIEVILNPKFQSARVAQGLLLALESLRRNDSLLVFANVVMPDATEVLRVAHASSADVALIRPQPTGHLEESAWTVDEKGKVKPTPPGSAPNAYFGGLLKVSAEGVPALKRTLEDPKWWGKPLADALVAWTRHRTLYTLQ